MKSADFTGSAAVQKAEGTIEDMEAAATKGEELAEELQRLSSQFAPNQTGHTNASAKYYPVMYFVDKSFVSMPSTCAGAAAAKPGLGTLDQCARACDGLVHDCVGLSWFPTTAGGLCFVMSKMVSTTYYTQCGGAANATAFLQKRSGSAASLRASRAGRRGDAQAPGD